MTVNVTETERPGLERDMVEEPQLYHLGFVLIFKCRRKPRIQILKEIGWSLTELRDGCYCPCMSIRYAADTSSVHLGM